MRSKEERKEGRKDLWEEEGSLVRRRDGGPVEGKRTARKERERQSEASSPPSSTEIDPGYPIRFSRLIYSYHKEERERMRRENIQEANIGMRRGGEPEAAVAHSCSLLANNKGREEKRLSPVELPRLSCSQFLSALCMRLLEEKRRMGSFFWDGNVTTVSTYYSTILPLFSVLLGSVYQSPNCYNCSGSNY